MTYSLLLALSVLVLMIVGLRAIRGTGHRVRDISELETWTMPVDLPAFRNLISPDEEEYLRTHLSKTDFRAVQRKRALAAAAYVRCIAHNAAVLLRLGEMGRSSADPEVVRTAQELVNSAIRLRLQAWIALGRLSITVMFPGARLTSGSFVRGYEELTGIVTTLTKLQRPAYAPRIAAIM